MNRFYTSRDMVKIACAACEGCGDCCRGMGDTIRLDPYDIFRLTCALSCTFEDLLDVRIALHSEDGIALPHLKMDESAEACTFLGADGRCGIHTFRPGYCRLFPLGRDYDGTGFRYFIVENGCDMPGKTKIRIDKWLGIPNLPEYERFTSRWHYFIKNAKERLAGASPSFLQQFNYFLLNTFYAALWPEDDFYAAFHARMDQAERLFSTET